jgi:hypothetical protein
MNSAAANLDYQRVWATPDTPAANTAAVITLTGVTDITHVIDEIVFGYNDVPTSGLLTVVNGSTTLVSVPVTSAGPHSLAPIKGIAGTSGANLVVTLAGAGAAVSGSVNVQYH